MRFLTRAAGGLILTAITLGLIGLGVWRLQDAIDTRETRHAAPVRERAYAVEVARLRPQTVRPVITAYGEIRAWRMLELRAAAEGVITTLSPRFRDGAGVAGGTLLFAVDPSDYERRVRDAELGLVQARTDLAEAGEAMVLVAAETRIARRQLGLEDGDLARKTALKDKGVLPQATLDTARNAVASAQQTLNARLKAELAAKMRVRTAELAVERAEIALEDARKALADTRYHAPFAGPLTGVVATLGRRVNRNEVLGTLIDMTTLEVSFRVSDAAFGRLLAEGDGSALKRLGITARLALGERRIEVAGTVERAAPLSRLSQGGRVVFARIQADAQTPLRPGDFVTVEIAEEPIHNVAVIPAGAATQDGRVFVLDAHDRLEEVAGRILRRQTDGLVMADLPFGRRYATARLPYLGAGVAVSPRRAGAAPGTAAPPAMISLETARRRAIVAFVKARTGMPPEIRARILSALAKPRVPASMVERLEARISGAGR